MHYVGDWRNKYPYWLREQSPELESLTVIPTRAILPSLYITEIQPCKENSQRCIRARGGGRQAHRLQNDEKARPRDGHILGAHAPRSPCLPSDNMLWNHLLNDHQQRGNGRRKPGDRPKIPALIVCKSVPNHHCRIDHCTGCDLDEHHKLQHLAWAPHELDPSPQSYPDRQVASRSSEGARRGETTHVVWPVHVDPPRRDQSPWMPQGRRRHQCQATHHQRRRPPR
mmetsp:Transcript_676/g.1402  ORF Transcript_676/g.1402 Transcript_676/m.1402 type:complete len:226 (-) Transcript_676:140-817(-)